MPKFRQTSGKREREKQRQKEKLEKREKMEERRANQTKGKPLEEMLAFVDENGEITSVRPDPEKRTVVKAEDIDISVPNRNGAEDPLKVGKIDYFDGFRGYGIILQKDESRIFFHVSRTTYAVKEGDYVNYQLERGPKGWHAVDVTKAPQ